MALQETGKISHKDIMTEFDHPRADFKLSGDGAPILQRPNGAKVAESDFYGLAAGGDTGCADWGACVFGATEAKKFHYTEDGYTWIESGLGPLVANNASNPAFGPDYIWMYTGRNSEGFLGHDPAKKINDWTSISTESQRSYRFSGALLTSQGKRLGGFGVKYGPNPGGVIYRDFEQPVDQTPGTVSISYNGASYSPFGTCNPSPCKQPASTSEFGYAPGTKRMLSTGLTTYSTAYGQSAHIPEKYSQNCISFAYGGTVGYQNPGAVQSMSYPVSQHYGSGKLLGVGNLIWRIHSKQGGGLASWDTAASPTVPTWQYHLGQLLSAGTGSSQTESNGTFNIWNGAYYYAVDTSGTRNTPNRAGVWRATNPAGPWTQVTSGVVYQGNYTMSYGYGHSQLLISPDGNALVALLSDGNNCTHAYSTRNGTQWTKTKSFGYAQNSRYKIHSPQIWSPG